MDTQENQQVVVWCEPCGAEVGHWRINAALRICTGCGNEIHEEEKIMAKHFTDAERAGIQLQLAQGAQVKDLAKEMGRSYHTIVSIKRAMPTGAKLKKLIEELAQKVEVKGTGARVMGTLPRGVSLADVGSGLSKQLIPGPHATNSKNELLKFIAQTINQRLGEIELNILTQLNYMRSMVNDYLK